MKTFLKFNDNEVEIQEMQQAVQEGMSDNEIHTLKAQVEGLSRLLDILEPAITIVEAKLANWPAITPSFALQDNSEYTTTQTKNDTSSNNPSSSSNSFVPV